MRRHFHDHPHAMTWAASQAASQRRRYFVRWLPKAWLWEAMPAALKGTQA